MSKKQTVVLFQEGVLPRIYSNPYNIKRLEELGTVLINPKMPKAPPHQWYAKDGKIMVNRDKPLLEIAKRVQIAKEKTGLQLECDINQLSDELDAKNKQLLEIIENKETIIIDKYKFLCNISVLGFFILLFLVLYIDTIKQIFERV